MRKWILAFSCFFLSLYCLPQFASFKWIKRQVEAQLETHIGGKVNFKVLKLSWKGPQTCEEIEWISGKGRALSVKALHISSNLIDCIRFSDAPLDVELEGGELYLNRFGLIKTRGDKPIKVTLNEGKAHIEKGVISFDGLNLLVNESLPATLDGAIDLQRERMNIVLALPAETLRKIFKQCRHLPQDFQLEIPLHCVLSGKALEKKLFWYFVKNYAKVTSLHK